MCIHYSHAETISLYGYSFLYSRQYVILCICLSAIVYILLVGMGQMDIIIMQDTIHIIAVTCVIGFDV